MRSRYASALFPYTSLFRSFVGGATGSISNATIRYAGRDAWGAVYIDTGMQTHPSLDAAKITDSKIEIHIDTDKPSIVSSVLNNNTTVIQINNGTPTITELT